MKLLQCQNQNILFLFPQNIRNIKNRTSRHEQTVCLKNYSFRFCVFDDNALSSCKRWVNHHSPPKVYLAGACLVVSSWFQQWNTWNWRRLKEACPDIPEISQKMLVSQEKFEISDHSKNLRNYVSGAQEHSLKFWAKSKNFKKKLFCSSRNGFCPKFERMFLGSRYIMSEVFRVIWNFEVTLWNQHFLRNFRNIWAGFL